MKNDQQTTKQRQQEKLRRYARMFADLLIEELVRQKRAKVNPIKSVEKTEKLT